MTKSSRQVHPISARFAVSKRSKVVNVKPISYEGFWFSRCTLKDEAGQKGEDFI